MANSIDISIDTDQLKRKIESLSGVLTAKEIKRAVYLGVNVAAARVRTIATKKIRAVYNIRLSYLVGSYIKIRKANANVLHAWIEMSERTIPMSEFLKSKASNKKPSRPKSLGAKSTAPIRNAQGVSVEVIKGHKELLKGAFLFASRYNTSTRLSIMHRSNVTGSSSYNGSFQFRHKRSNPTGSDLHIGAIFSVSPLHTVFNKAVSDTIHTQGGAILQCEVNLKLNQMAAGLIRTATKRGGRP